MIIKCGVAAYSWPPEGSSELQMTHSDFTSVVELDAILFRDMFVLYHQTAKKKKKSVSFCLFSRIFKLAAAEGGGAEEGAAMRAAGGQQQQRQQKQRGVVVGGGGGAVSVDVLPFRHKSHSFLWRFTPPFILKHLAR